MNKSKNIKNIRYMAKKDEKKVMEENEEVKGQQTVEAEPKEEKNTEETSKEEKEPSSQENTDEKVKDTEESKEPKEVVKEINIDFKDKYIRLSAEFDNYRKRTAKEKVEVIKNASGDILQKMLPIIDDFERAVGSMDQAKDIEAVKNGIELIYNKFNDFLKANGLKEIDALHKEFDTDLHEALTKIPAPEKDLKGKIIDVVQKGYTLNDNVIRFSKVVIGE